MKAKHSTNRKLSRMFANVLRILVILALAFPVTGSALAQDEPPPPPNPFIAVSLTEHWFWVNNFAPETLVTFSIYDNQGASTPILEFGKPTDALGNLTIDGWAHIWDPEPGDYIVATDGTNTKDLVLEYITLDIFDPGNDLVSGHAWPGREIGVGVGNETGEQWMNVFADDQTGEWIADFKLEGFVFDITENSWAGGHVNDEDGDVTAAHNSGPPEPPAWFTVFPEQDAVEAWDFPMGAVVHLEIEDPTTEVSPDHQQDEPVVFAPWGSWQLWVWFDFAGKYDMKAGDIVTLSYGGTIRTHTVQNLSVTKVDQVDDTVKGMADPGAEVYVWPHATGQEQLATAKTQGQAMGKWNADFSGIFDLVPGECGRSEIRDEFGNRTAVDWCVPMPTFVAYMPVTIVGYDWPKGDTIDISINGDEYIAQADVGNADWDPTVVLFELWRDDFTMEAGDHIVMTDEASGITKEVWVTNLAVTDFDLNASQVFGTYNPAYDLWVWLYDLEGQVLETDPDKGTWVATFTEIPLSAWGGATQWDEDGDGTSIDFQAPGGQAGNFTVQWSQTNPEEVTYLSWNGSENLTNSTGDLEFFGNSWVSETEGTDDFFFASLVGWCTTGTWEGTSSSVNINSISSGCPGSADIPVNTQYQFFDDKPDLIMIQRTFEFGDTSYAHNVRPFIPRLYPWNGFTQVLHPNTAGDTLVTETWPAICDFGCVAEDWDGSWFAIQNPYTGVGMIVQSASGQVALWLDNDGASFTNSSSVLLLQPDGGFAGTVTETEYLCFYDRNTWTPALTLPDGCQP